MKLLLKLDKVNECKIVNRIWISGDQEKIAGPIQNKNSTSKTRPKNIPWPGPIFWKMEFCRNVKNALWFSTKNRLLMGINLLLASDINIYYISLNLFLSSLLTLLLWFRESALGWNFPLSPLTRGYKAAPYSLVCKIECTSGSHILRYCNSCDRYPRLEVWQYLHSYLTPHS